MMDTLYFDNNATTRLLPAVRDRLKEIIATPYGNPSSAHSYGDYSRDIIRNSREVIANSLKCVPMQLIFTSGASEANNQVLQSLLFWDSRPKTLITTEIEHSSVLSAASYLEYAGCRIIMLPVDKTGVIKRAEFEDALKNNPGALVSIGWANGETGVIQPIDELISLSHANDCLFHTDAVQMYGKKNIDIRSNPVDFLTISGHKLHGPQGIGVLYAKDMKKLFPLIHGGGHEQHKRAGTENILGIGGIGEAVVERFRDLPEAIQHMQQLRDTFESELLTRLDDLTVNAGEAQRTPNTTNIQFRGIDGRALMAQLDIQGVACSQTSACESMLPQPSHVLSAMGLTEDEGFSSIRFSFAVDNTIEEVMSTVEIIGKIVNKLRSLTLWG